MVGLEWPAAQMVDVRHQLVDQARKSWKCGNGGFFYFSFSFVTKLFQQNWLIFDLLQMLDRGVTSNTNNSFANQ